MAILHRFAPVVEEASIDEAYFDLSFAGSFEAAADICRQIKREIQEKERLTGSIGLGPNKLIAKIASDFQKPDGLTVVTAEEAENFLAPLPVRKIPGIGPKTEKSLARLGIKMVRDLKRFSRQELQRGSASGARNSTSVSGAATRAPWWWNGSPSPWASRRPLHRFPGCCTSSSPASGSCAMRSSKGLQAEGFQTYRTVVLTVRFADFDTKSRSRTLPSPLRLARASCASKP